MFQMNDEFVDEGTQATDTSNTGGSNFWDTATAVLDIAGNVVQILDSAGNDITDEVDSVDIPDDPPPATDNSTLYWILGSAFFFILLLMAFLLLRKKK